MKDFSQIIQLLSVSIIPMIFAITVHEAAHGWLANRLGDPTAKSMGRLTFNPIPHIDLVGTILVPLVMFVTSGFLFGWAKPVPINGNNLRVYRRDMAYVAIAGPASNLLMALAWVIILKLAHSLAGFFPAVAVPLASMAQVGVYFNLILMLLNLIPLPPLDGSRVLAWLVPPRIALLLDRIEPYGFFILLGLLFLGFWQAVVGPIFQVLYRGLLALVGL